MRATSLLIPILAVAAALATAAPMPADAGQERVLSDRLQRIDRIRDRLQDMDRAERLQRLRRLERHVRREWIERRLGRTVAERRAASRELFVTTRRGDLVVRNEILALNPRLGTLEKARSLGFPVKRRRTLGADGIEIVTLGTPESLSMDEALERLRGLAPDESFDFNHLFDPSGAKAAAEDTAILGGTMPWSDLGPAAGLSIGLVDLGVDLNHPALAAAAIEARSFTGEDAPVPSAHGTAVASLLAGRYGDFAGAAVGARLVAADVFGDADTGGTAETIAAALEWLAEEAVPVIAMPIVGPPNLLIEIMLERLATRGVVVVAPVGNDGPTRPVAYPAAYPHAVAVTATDFSGNALLQAHRGKEVAFAAVGVGLPAAIDPEKLEAVAGTSFAVPEVAARLLRVLAESGDPEAAVATLKARTRDLGAPGRDDVYGHGWVSFGGGPAVAAQSQEKE